MGPEFLQLLAVASSAAIAATAAYSIGLCFVRKEARSLHLLSTATAVVSSFYGLSYSLQPRIGPGPLCQLTERAQFAALLLLGPLLIWFSVALRGIRPTRHSAIAPLISLVLIALVIFTPLVITSRFSHFNLLMPVGCDPEPGPLAPLVLLHLLVCGVHSAHNFFRYAAGKRTWLKWIIYSGTVLYVGTGLNDALVKLGLLNTGYLLAFGILGCAATIVTVGLVNHVEAIEAVERSRHNLETAVEARTQALRDAQARLMQEHQLAALGRLSAGIAHEINNPLAAIQANLSFLHEAFPPEAYGPQIEAALRESLEACQRTSQIVKDLSSLSRRRRGSVRRLRLEIPVQTAIRFLTRSHPLARNVQLKLDPEVYVTGDETGLGQIAVNLLENALQAIEDLPKGSGRVVVEVRAQNGESILSIEDNGPGVPAEIRPQIFDPFFTTKRVGRGTGLGLSICASIVADHDGSIQVEDVVSGGAKFVVRLPAS